MMEPVLAWWWLRPDLSAIRVGEHRAVEWKLLYRRPEAARRSRVGVWSGPPNVLGPPKPMSSIRTITTLGAPSGASTSNRGGGSTSRASSSVYVGGFGSWMGRTVRSTSEEEEEREARWLAQAATTAPAASVPSTERASWVFIGILVEARRGTARGREPSSKEERAPAGERVAGAASAGPERPRKPGWTRG